MRSTSIVRGAAVALLAATALLVPATAQAQSDFMLKRPSATVSLFGGWAVPGEGSDLFGFARDQVTLEEGDFESPLVIAEGALRMSEHFDLTAGLEVSSRTVSTEMRDWVTSDDRPIPQTTRFTRTRLHVGARAYLLPRGRSISRFAWIPNRWSPYVGGGVGVTRFEFEQVGDFVDYETLDIFADELEAVGDGFTTHVLAGVQLSLTPRLLLRGEYRHVWGNGSPDSTDFYDFEDVDLSGSAAIIGVSVRL